MASIGLRYPYAAKREYNESTGTATYSGGMTIGKAISADITINKTDSNILYADDSAAENVPSVFTDGKITLGTDDITDEASVFLFASTVDSETVNGEQVSVQTFNTDDMAPTLGVGHIVTKMKNSQKLYRAIFYHKVQFSVPSESFATQAGSITWQTPTIEGVIMSDENGDWKEEITVEDLQTAINWLKKKLMIPETAAAQTLSARTSTTTEKK